MKEKIDRSTGEIKFEYPRLRSAYDRHDDFSRDTGLKCEDESLTSQSGKDDADINTLVRRFGLTGQLPVDVRAPYYGDFTDLPDFQTALNRVLAAKAAFMAMPANVRSEFNNDPGKFVDFCSKEENYDRMVDLGLLAPEPIRKAVEARQAKANADLMAKVDAEIQKRNDASKAPSGATHSSTT